MMKRLGITAITIAALLTAGRVHAQTATQAAGTPTPTVVKDSKLEDLKERLATKVAELRQLTKRAIYGTIKATSVSTFTVETKTSDVKIELTDDITVIQVIKGKRTTLTSDNLEKGDAVTVFGDYDTGLELLKAKIVFIQAAIPTRVAGTVTETDEKAFTVTVKTPANQTYVIDVEKTTTALLWDKEKGIVKGGFSKIAVGDTLHVSGFPVPKKENRISASRLLALGNLSGETPTPTPEPTATPTPTEKPAAKTTPTSKTTPKATPTP